MFTIKLSKNPLIKWGIVIAVSILVFFLIYEANKNINLATINNNLHVDGIMLGMEEKELVKQWGDGQYQEGFGGHFREYSHLGVSIGIAGDGDNDLYQKVSSIRITNPLFSLFTIKVGGDRESGIRKLIANKFIQSKDSEDIYNNGEFSIMLNGTGTIIDKISLWFNDKDLRDRVY